MKLKAIAISLVVLSAVCAFGQSYGSFRDTGGGLITNQPWCFEATQMGGWTGCINRSPVTGVLGVYPLVGNSSAVEFIGGSLGTYQGVTSVGITDTAFHALVAANSDVAIPAGLLPQAGTTAFRKLRVKGSGVYTNAAASLLNVEVMLCTVSGCGSGTVVAPAGCVVTTTNQANNLTNGQFTFECALLTTGTVGSSGTFMAKATGCANLGTATTAVLSCFADTATAVSAAVDQTVNEYVNPAFKFSSSNAGNSVTLMEYSVDVVK